MLCLVGCFLVLSASGAVFSLWGKQRVRDWFYGAWVGFFFLNVLREVALSCGACWIEIEVIVRQAGLVICNSSNDRSEFVAKLPRNISDFNRLVPLLELKIRCHGE